jgi:hypothetical protein
MGAFPSLCIKEMHMTFILLNHPHKYQRITKFNQGSSRITKMTTKREDNQGSSRITSLQSSRPSPSTQVSSRITKMTTKREGCLWLNLQQGSL